MIQVRGGKAQKTSRRNMRKKKKTVKALVRMFFIPALAGFLLSSGGCARVLQKEEPLKADVSGTQANPENKAVPSATLTGITISFKLDPRLTRGLYMGDRWVSPATYTSVGEEKELTVDARVRGLDSEGRPKNISPTWIPSDPDMVAVSPSRGNVVKIIVHRAGQSRLKVVSPGFTKELSLKATYIGAAIHVEISQ